MITMMKNSFSFACVACSFTFLSFNSWSQTGNSNETSLETGLCKLLDYDALLASRTFQDRQFYEQVLQAKSLTKPTLSAFSNSTLSTGSLSSGAFRINDPALSIGINTSVPLYTSGQNKALLERAKLRSNASEHQTKSIQQSLLREGVEAYLEVLLQEQILQILEANVSTLATLEQRAIARFDIGSGTRTDISQARASLKSAEANLISARLQKDTILVRFNQRFGFYPVRLSNKLDISVPKISSANELVALSLAKNPELLEQDLTALASSKTVGAEKASNGLRVDLVAGYQETFSDNEFAATQDGANVRVLFSLPLYEGGARRSRVREAKAAESQQKALRLNLSREVSAQAQVLWANLLAIKERRGVIQEQEAAAKVALDGALEEQKLGKRATFEVLNIQNTLISTRLSAERVETELITTKIEIAELLGEIENSVVGLKNCPR